MRSWKYLLSFSSEKVGSSFQAYEWMVEKSKSLSKSTWMSFFPASAGAARRSRPAHNEIRRGRGRTSEVADRALDSSRELASRRIGSQGRAGTAVLWPLCL